MVGIEHDKEISLGRKGQKMNLIELVSEKISKKQIVGVATLVILLQIEAPAMVKAVCVTLVGITAIVVQGILDYKKDVQKETTKVD